MSIEKNKVEFFHTTSWAEKASCFLLIAQAVTKNFAEGSETQLDCNKAINLCWNWLGHGGGEPKDLAFYIDSDLTLDGSLAEQNFADGGEEQNSLILILLVVAFFANRAYRVVGLQRQMSESINEAGEESEEYIINCIEKLGLKNSLLSMMDGSVWNASAHPSNRC